MEREPRCQIEFNFDAIDHFCSQEQSQEDLSARKSLVIQKKVKSMQKSDFYEGSSDPQAWKSNNYKYTNPFSFDEPEPVDSPPKKLGFSCSTDKNLCSTQSGTKIQSPGSSDCKNPLIPNEPPNQKKLKLNPFDSSEDEVFIDPMAKKDEKGPVNVPGVSPKKKTKTNPFDTTSEEEDSQNGTLGHQQGEPDVREELFLSPDLSIVSSLYERESLDSSENSSDDEFLSETSSYELEHSLEDSDQENPFDVSLIVASQTQDRSNQLTVQTQPLVQQNMPVIRCYQCSEHFQTDELLCRHLVQDCDYCPCVFCDAYYPSGILVDHFETCIVRAEHEREAAEQLRIKERRAEQEREAENLRRIEEQRRTEQNRALAVQQYRFRQASLQMQRQQRAFENANPDLRARNFTRDFFSGFSLMRNPPNQTLKPTSMTEKTASSSDTQNGCAICQENFAEGEKIKVLKCAHEFHAECINTDVEHRIKNFQQLKCPMCRDKIT